MLMSTRECASWADVPASGWTSPVGWTSGAGASGRAAGRWTVQRRQAGQRPAATLAAISRGNRLGVQAGVGTELTEEVVSVAFAWSMSPAREQVFPRFQLASCGPLTLRSESTVSPPGDPVVGEFRLHSRRAERCRSSIGPRMTKSMVIGGHAFSTSCPEQLTSLRD